MNSPATKPENRTAEPHTESGSPPPPEPQDGRSPRGRWAVAVVVACLAGVPLGILLAYAALLPFMIGLFFFALFGLIVGAVLFRIGKPLRPMSRGTVAVGATVAIAFTWLVALAYEAHDFPAQVAEAAYKQPVRLPEGVVPRAYLRESREQTVEFMRENFPPGGLIGYVRWAATSSRIDPPTAHLRRPYVENRLTWCIRVVLSILLLSYAVWSQAAPLTRPTEPPGRPTGDTTDEAERTQVESRSEPPGGTPRADGPNPRAD